MTDDWHERLDSIMLPGETLEEVSAPVKKVRNKRTRTSDSSTRAERWAAAAARTDDQALSVLDPGSVSSSFPTSAPVKESRKPRSEPKPIPKMATRTPQALTIIEEQRMLGVVEDGIDGPCTQEARRRAYAEDRARIVESHTDNDIVLPSTTGSIILRGRSKKLVYVPNQSEWSEDVWRRLVRLSRIRMHIPPPLKDAFVYVYNETNTSILLPGTTTMLFAQGEYAVPYQAIKDDSRWGDMVRKKLILISDKPIPYRERKRSLEYRRFGGITSSVKAPTSIEEDKVPVPTITSSAAPPKVIKARGKLYVKVAKPEKRDYNAEGWEYSED